MQILLKGQCDKIIIRFDFYSCQREGLDNLGQNNFSGQYKSLLDWVTELWNVGSRHSINTTFGELSCKGWQRIER